LQQQQQKNAQTGERERELNGHQAPPTGESNRHVVFHAFCLAHKAATFVAVVVVVPASSSSLILTARFSSHPVMSLITKPFQ
jgi:hypothetical protein